MIPKKKKKTPINTRIFTQNTNIYPLVFTQCPSLLVT